MRSLLPLLLIAAATAADVADLTIRYVNNEVVTMGDVMLRNAIRKDEYLRRGMVLPRTQAELITFSKKSLDDLTDDVLLAQRAKEMGIQADHDEIVFEVLAQAKRSGVGYSLRDQAEQRRHLERQRTIERITGWYESMMPAARPEDLVKIYQGNKDAFNRPSQSRILQIVLRPTSPDERAALRAGKAALLRAGQDSTDTAIKASVDARLTAFLAADNAGQDPVLDQLVADLAPLTARTDLSAADRTLVTQAADLANRGARLLDQHDVKARLEAARMSLTGFTGEAQIDAFRDLAKRISQGPAASRGGEMGTIEPGLYAKEFDAVAFALDKGELSQVFWIGDIACLLLCADRKEAQIRSFNEVSSEIENKLRWQRRADAREQAVRILRAKASIRDINGMDKLGN